MKKWQVENSGKSEISEISKSFLIFEFSYFRVFDFARKHGFKNLGKKCPRFPSCRLGTSAEGHEKKNKMGVATVDSQ